MKILVINLDRSPDRLEFQRAQFAILGLDFERVPATTGTDVDDTYYERMKASGTRLMTRNEVACFLSHKACWRKCADGTDPVLVMEDDAVLSADFAEFAKTVFDWANEKDMFVNLEHFSRKKLLGRHLQTLPGGTYSLDELVFASGGAAAYVITPQIARKLLSASEKSISLTDTFVYGLNNVRYAQVVPAMAVQAHLVAQQSENRPSGDLGSTISAGHRKPTSWESFAANPMTRLRRLQANYTRWRRMRSAGNTLRRNAMTATPGVAHMLDATRKVLSHG